MLDGPGVTGCNFSVCSCWDSRDVIVAAVFDCVKQCNGTLQPVPPVPSSFNNDAYGIEKLLLKTQVS